MTFRELVSAWDTFGRLNVSDGWRGTQDQMLRDHILPIIGDIKLSNLTSAKIVQVLRGMETRELSTQLRIHVFNLMNRIFKDAIELAEMNIVNPVKKQIKPKLVYKDTPFLKPEHSYMLLAESVGTTFESAVFLEILAGLRVGETQALEWVDVDFDNEELVINRTYNRKTNKIQTYLKNKKNNRIPMPPLLMEHLWTRRKKAGFVVEINGRMMVHGSYFKYVKRLCRQLGIPVVSPHGLRHSCTELWINAGATIVDLMRLLNHSDTKTTKRYVHRSNERLKFLSLRITKSFKKVA